VYRFKGALKEVPSAVFQSVMTPVEEDSVPIANARQQALFDPHQNATASRRQAGVMLLGVAASRRRCVVLSRQLHERPLEGARSQPGAPGRGKNQWRP
jgi:hypothetical protein